MMNVFLNVFCGLILINRFSWSLDNGLALTPPMGWISWTRFTCELDCDRYPGECINEQLYKDMADRMAADGYQELGYEYVNIDDCWSLKERDPVTKKLIPDPVRFPSGIKALAAYVHSKGLKLGIYGDMGLSTCAGYPGLLTEKDGSGQNYFQIDAETFASWDIDMYKVDGCFADSRNFSTSFPQLGLELNKTGRPILYSCEWPFYEVQDYDMQPDYESVAKHCNMWRNQHDVDDSWENVASIIDYYGDNHEKFVKYNHPGAWFDPDMLVIGNYGLSLDQSRAQMAFWSILGVPLFMSNDLRRIDEEAKSILQNRYLIEVNQDVNGFMGKRVLPRGTDGIEVWMKPVQPIVNGSYSFAIVYFNRYNLGTPKHNSRSLRSILGNEGKSNEYEIHDLFDNGRSLGKVSVNGNLTLQVRPSGGVRVVKLVPSV